MEPTNNKNFSLNVVVKGKVNSIKPYGCFVNLESGIQGFIHISEISDYFIKDINTILKIGSIYDFLIIKEFVPGERLFLSYKRIHVKQQKKIKTNTIKESPSGFEPLKKYIDDIIKS